MTNTICLFAIKKKVNIELVLPFQPATKEWVCTFTHTHTLCVTYECQDPGFSSKTVFICLPSSHSAAWCQLLQCPVLMVTYPSYACSPVNRDQHGRFFTAFFRRPYPEQQKCQNRKKS